MLNADNNYKNDTDHAAKLTVHANCIVIKLELRIIFNYLKTLKEVAVNEENSSIEGLGII